MNTRHRNEAGPLSQNRYMSSVEFAELHGVNGIAVSARAAILIHQAKRELVWFLQALSLNEGGLRRVAKGLIEMFPNRLGTAEMQKAGVRPGKKYNGELISGVQVDLGMLDEILRNEGAESERGETLLEWCRDAALSKHHYDHNSHDPRPLSIEEFLIDLCINPRVSFSLPGEKIDTSEFEAERAIEKNPELDKSDFRTAKLVYFQDIIGALLEYKRRHETKTREGFFLTAIGKKIWETLDYALASRGMVVLDGLEGRGKTEAVKAWCQLHLGAARFVSLKGIGNKTNAFREIAKALGIGASYTRKSTEMQTRIEDVLKRSKLLLIIDEAHFLFNQSRRLSSRPELVDWIDTALCNCGIGCALVTTPQFLICMTRAADQVEWNYRQFRRRVRRWVKLPQSNTEADIHAVARSVFPKVSETGIKKIVGYALLSKRDVSAVGDVATELRVMTNKEDLRDVSTEQIHNAIYEFLLPSDKAFLEGMESSRTRGRKLQRQAIVSIPQISDSKEDEELPDANAPRASRAENFAGESRLKTADLTTL